MLRAIIGKHGWGSHQPPLLSCRRGGGLHPFKAQLGRAARSRRDRRRSRRPDARSVRRDGLGERQPDNGFSQPSVHNMGLTAHDQPAEWRDKMGTQRVSGETASVHSSNARCKQGERSFHEIVRPA